MNLNDFMEREDRWKRENGLWTPLDQFLSDAIALARNDERERLAAERLLAMPCSEEVN